jgi:MFS family permease
MAGTHHSLRAEWELLRGTTTRLTTGGEWALALPAWSRRNLSLFWLDGFFGAACDNIIATYLVLYILTLGASRGQIGLMSSLSSLMAAIFLLPGALLVERAGHRKQLCLVGGGLGRLALVFLAALPLVAGGETLVFLAISLSVSRDTFLNLVYPAWMSLAGDLVPFGGRGRYFASRNFAMGAAGMATTLLIGQVITHSSQPAGYQAALLIAFGFGVGSFLSFSRLRDPNDKSVTRAMPGRAAPTLLKDLAAQPGFLALIGTTALWNFSVNVPGPFFTVYLVQNLNASAVMVGIVTIASSFSTLLAQRRLGALADRWGARRLQIVSGLLIPVVPVAWVFAQVSWNIIPINFVSGALWAAYNLASFNYLLALIPDDKRARFSAIYQVVVMLSLSAGAAVGGLLVTTFGYPVIFWGSGTGRLAAALLFARFSAAPVEASTEPES